MFKKTILFFLIGLVVTNISYAQKLMHSVGATISVLYGKENPNPLFPNSSNKFTMSQTLLSYFPRYNFSEADNSSFSIGAPVGVGVGIASNTNGDDAGVSFAYDLPIVIDYNFGCKATSEIESNFGGYVGVGFGYYRVSISKSAYSDFTGTTYGPMGRAGIRFGSENWNGKAVTVGLFYKSGLEKSKLKTIGFNVLYDF
jgi:hypothetical protein